MKIETYYNYPPIPSTKFDWMAIDVDTYGVCSDPNCECRGSKGSLIGYGKTQQEAIDDLVRQREEAD